MKTQLNNPDKHLGDSTFIFILSANAVMFLPIPFRNTIHNAGPFQTSTMRTFAKIVCNVNLKQSTILAEIFILDAWLGGECASTGAYNTVLKIQPGRSPWLIKMIS